MAVIYPSSAREAWETLRRLADALEAPARRSQALAELRALAELARGKAPGAPLRLATVDVTVGSAHEQLEILLLPSIFEPEEWAYTFLEGLLEVPLDEYAGKRLVEVGSGSGWIALALGKLTGLAEIRGLDLNPQAAAVARCNVWLNGDEALAARLRFGESDLLKGLPADAGWDFVVGCIPQVLRADGDPQLAELDAGDRALYDLSNYTAVQNVYEDHFGLGLIARLLDECPEQLAPGGRLLLNIAGRPGRAIIERMFSRRGFDTEVQVVRRVRQAADTDIGPLVALERRTGSEFEFFVEQRSPEPIRAETALRWLEAGNPIWHEVAVWKARLRLPREVLALRAALDRLGMPRLVDELDLGVASQEQLGFVAALAERLADQPLLPYAHEAGDVRFRELVARYLDRYFGLRLAPGDIFVGPARAQTLYSLLLATCDPGDGVLVSRNVHPVYAEALARAGVNATVTNDVLREIRGLLGAFDVKVVILSVEPEERTNLGALRAILDEAAERGILVILDESPSFTITRGIEPWTLFELLAREPDRPNLVVLCGLIKNSVYPDFELTLLLPVAGRLHADLEVAAEITYSRIVTPIQWFYERLFAELLSFRIAFTAPEPAPGRRRPPARLPRSRRMERASTWPAFAPPVFRDDDPDLVRLDYGENEGPIPAPLVEGLVAACAAPRTADPGSALPEAIAAFLLETRGARYAADDIVAAQGVWPLMHDLGVALGQRLGRAPRIHIATPCYGLLAPTFEASGCSLELGPLDAVLASAGGDAPDAVVFSQPANPTGRYLSREELVALAAWAVENQVWLISDEVFGLVNLSHVTAETVLSPVSIDQAVPGASARVLLLGGLSKELAAGGLRIGWLATRDRALADSVRGSSLGAPSLVAARAAAHVYAAWSRSSAGRLLHPGRHRALCDHLTRMRRALAEQRARLAAALPAEDLAPGDQLGGLFLAPPVTAWLGRTLAGETVTPETLPRLLHAATSVVVNGGPWSGDPERIRAVFSIPRDRLHRAADRLRALPWDESRSPKDPEP
jgi:aspartate/methionine/tyrosine aminotransferase/methylase of polypeptide subunit release factors